ncbi:MAG TPA: hypothetical protein VF250_03225 [Conexibacter sp.]
MGAKHLIVVGGLVPPLLAPDAADAHQGSADIDLCLSVAIVHGATREYCRSIEEHLDPWFELMSPSGFRLTRIRHAGPVGFLAAKADALDGRDDPKDGYDVAWWCLNAAARPMDVAELVLTRPAFAHPLFQESVALLQRAFRAPDYPGPDGYARELHPHLEAGDELYELARNAAYASVAAVIELLVPRLWDGGAAR